MKKFLKQFYGVILGIFLLGVVFSAPALKQWNNSKAELSQYRMLFTDTGLPNGTPVIDINSGGSNISYGPLLDGEGNPYITGVDLSGYLTGFSETDPVFNSWLLTPPNVSTFVNDAGYSNIDVQTDNFPVGVPGSLTGSMLWKVGNDSLGVYNTMVATDSFHSFAFGRQSFIDGTGTFAMGLGTKAINDDMVVMGRFNDGLVGTILEIGKGTSELDRQNALTILDNGNVGIGTTGPANILEINGEASYTNTGDMGTDDTDFASKWYVDTSLTDYVPRTAVDTGWNNTGSDTIIPSEKLVWSLVSGLNNDYIPIWDGNKFINSSIFKTTNFLSLAHISTGAFLRIHDDFIYASTDIVDWKITENVFKIGTPDSGTTGVYIEGKMRNGVMDIYADTGVNIDTPEFKMSTGTRLIIGEKWSIVESGNTLSIQALTGGVWVEKESFSND